MQSQHSSQGGLTPEDRCPGSIHLKEMLWD